MSQEILNDEALDQVSGGASLKVIGKAQVVTTNLNIRRDATTKSERLGMTNAPAQYDVYEIVQNEGYIWYRIDINKWIANDGTWVVFSAK